MEKRIKKWREGELKKKGKEIRNKNKVDNRNRIEEEGKGEWK